MWMYSKTQGDLIFPPLLISAVWEKNIVKYCESEGGGGVSWVDCPLTQIQTCGHLLRPLTHHNMPDFSLQI